MPSLSVVMIVKNESAWLDACLDSVRAIADEIVVGDTGSTDATVSIAKDYDAIVLDVPWTDDFARARNAVLAAATGDWLLHMDADETVDESGAKRIREIVERDGDGADAVEVMLANYSDDVRAWRWVPVSRDDPRARGRTGYIAVPLLRLFRNRRGFEYREPVHENITESVLERDGVVCAAHDVLIHHHGYGKQDAGKAMLYLRIAEMKVEQRPADPKAWHDLAEQLVAMDRADAAEPALRKALEIDPRHLGAATTLANILLNRGAVDEARRLLEPFVMDDAAPAHVCVALAAIAVKQGRMEDAEFLIGRALAAQPNHVLARLYAARIADVGGRHGEAREQLELAHDLAPGLEEVNDRIAAHELRENAERLMASGDPRAALAPLVSALKRDPEDALIHLRLSAVLRDLGDLKRAEESIDRARALAPSLTA